MCCQSLHFASHCFSCLAKILPKGNIINIQNFRSVGNLQTLIHPCITIQNSSIPKINLKFKINFLKTLFSFERIFLFFNVKIFHWLKPKIPVHSTVPALFPPPQPPFCNPGLYFLISIISHWYSSPVRWGVILTQQNSI